MDIKHNLLKNTKNSTEKLETKPPKLMKSSERLYRSHGWNKYHNENSNANYGSLCSDSLAVFELYARPARALQLKTQHDHDAFESCFERYFNLPKTNKMLKTILILFLEELICA